MSNELLNLIPNDILNLIWIQISPKYKYFLNKYYFEKYYSYRLYYIHNNKIDDIINLKISNFNNYSYYYYILTNDLLYLSKNILTLYITNNNDRNNNDSRNNDRNNNDNKYNKTKCYYKKFVYKNIVFYNLVDFFYYYCNNKSTIVNIINKYNLSHLIKKSHKNNVNKNIRWTL
jgi:hypothetical protein